MFIPILLMGGIVGRLFREFAVTLSIAIAVSALVSLTLTPDDGARLLRARRARRAHGRLYRAGERLFERLLAGYDRALALGARPPAAHAGASPLAAVRRSASTST